MSIIFMSRRNTFSTRFKRTLAASVALFIVFLIVMEQLHPLLVIRDLGYLTRPIWDSPGNHPEVLIPHFHSDNMSFDQLCHFHQWKPRTNAEEPKIIDAVLFSIELDILEIRLLELWSVVDLFVVVEADTTFTGKPKRLNLQENLERFKWASDKLVPFALTGVLSKDPRSSFENEGLMRRTVTDKILSLSVVNAGDLIVVSDTDEIPFPETLKLLKACDGYPDEIHLQMRNYLYSFEFYVDTTNWKPHVTRFNRQTFFYHHHRRSSDHLLADAGWHCSFCFRNLEDFAFKMTSYSHYDRVTHDRLLDPHEIQRKICSGSDIFDMFPEAYTFKELFASIGNIPKKHSTLGIPRSIVEKAEKFRFLLPGGCIRDDLS